MATLLIHACSPPHPFYHKIGPDHLLILHIYPVYSSGARIIQPSATILARSWRRAFFFFQQFLQAQETGAFHQGCYTAWGCVGRVKGPGFLPGAGAGSRSQLVFLRGPLGKR